MEESSFLFTRDSTCEQLHHVHTVILLLKVADTATESADISTSNLEAAGVSLSKGLCRPSGHNIDIIPKPLHLAPMLLHTIISYEEKKRSQTTMAILLLTPRDMKLKSSSRVIRLIKPITIFQ